MEERQNFRIERPRKDPSESTSIVYRGLFEDVVTALEELSPQKRRELFVRWDRAAFYSQGFASRGIVEYRVGLRPTPSIRTVTEKKGGEANISLFYQSGIFASAVLTICMVASTAFDLIAADLGIPIALALFGILLAFSVEFLRFRKRFRTVA